MVGAWTVCRFKGGGLARKRGGGGWYSDKHYGISQNIFPYIMVLWSKICLCYAVTENGYHSWQRRIAQYCCLQVWLKADLDPWDKENWCYISFFYALKNIWVAQKNIGGWFLLFWMKNAKICKKRDLKFVRKVASGSSFLSYIWYIIWHQNRLCNIFLHLDWQVIMNHFPFFHSEWVCLNARIFFFLYNFFFCIWFLKHLGTYSGWRLILKHLHFLWIFFPFGYELFTICLQCLKRNIPRYPIGYRCWWCISVGI